MARSTASAPLAALLAACAAGPAGRGAVEVARQGRPRPVQRPAAAAGHAREADILQRPARSARTARRAPCRRPRRLGRRRRRVAARSAPRTVDPELEAQAQEGRSRAGRQDEGRGRPRRRGQAPTTAAAPRASCATLESGIRMARTNDKGEREILDDTRAPPRPSAPATRSRPTASSQRGSAPALPARVWRAAAAPPSGRPPAAGRARPGRRRAARRRRAQARPQMPTGWRSSVELRMRCEQAAGAQRVEHRGAGRQPQLDLVASPARGLKATRRTCRPCRGARRSARPMHLLGAAHERIDEGVGDAVEHRADHRLEDAVRERVAQLELDLAGRRWRPARHRGAAAARSARGRRAARTGRRPGRRAPTRSGDLHVPRREGMAHAGIGQVQARRQARRRRGSSTSARSHHGRNCG